MSTNTSIKKIRFLSILRGNRSLQLLTLAIIAAAIPFTQILLHQTTVFQQNAASTNYCKTPIPNDGKPNNKGLCGAFGWGRCMKQGTCPSNFIAGKYDPKSSCRGYDDLSVCCYPKITPVPNKHPSSQWPNTAGLCGAGGYGRCISRNQCGSQEDFMSIADSPVKNGLHTSACIGYIGSYQQPGGYKNFGCCYPKTRTATQAICSADSGPGAGPGTCNPDKDYKECESGAKNACTDQLGPSIKGHLTHVTHDCNGWHCTDLGKCNASPKATPTPTPSPTPTPTPNSNTPTPTPTPTPAASGPTFLKVAVELSGIGKRGNLSPKHTTRTAHLSIYTKDTDPTQPNVTPVYDNKNIILTYNPQTGFFTNSSVSLGNNWSTSDYQVFIKSSGYLRKYIVDPTSSGKTLTLTQGISNLLPSVTLLAGDVAPLYNVFDISDFYALIDCFGDKAQSSSCVIGSQIADLNDDGTVNGIDLNLWLATQNQIPTQGASSFQGDGPAGE